MTDQDILDELRASARAVVDRAADGRRYDDPWVTEPDDDALWTQAGELGWTSLLVDERYGGAEAGMGAALVIVEELGRRTVTVPYLSSAVLGASALGLAGSPAQQQHWLPAIASGEQRAAVALCGPDGRDVTVEARDGRLTGQAGYVLDADAADILVVAASDGMYVVERADAAVTEHLSVDRSRRVATVVLEGAPAELLADLNGDAITRLHQRAGLALAADALGAARRALDISVTYAGERVQFGRPIGSFQAIKHKLADMYVLVQGAGAALAGAARAVDAGEPGAARLVAVAASFARDAATKVTGDAIQAHGGIGYTWEHECHRLFKRATFDELYLRTPASFRDELATIVLAPHRIPA